MNLTDSLGLTIAYWMHILATVIWIGGLSSLAIFVLPAARRSMQPGQYSVFLAALQSRIQQIGWFCLIVLIFTGMFQMISHPNYQGFLVISTPWAEAILIKHLTVAVMLGLSSYITWGLMPALQRMAFMQSVGKPGDPGVLEKLVERETFLLRLNLFLAVIVLLLTAWARTS
jgi:uncharacterized membrane protein